MLGLKFRFYRNDERIKLIFRRRAPSRCGSSESACCDALCLSSCSTDYVEVYSLRTALTPAESTDNLAISGSVRSASLLGRYCNEQLPGPQISEDNATAMRVVFVSNVDGINTGFRAKYEFIERKSGLKSKPMLRWRH